MSFIEVRSLRKEYKNTVAVDDIDLSVERGEIFGLLGPNGAGKSTTISMISGLLTPTSGSIFLKGEDVTKSPWKVKSILGLVPQDIASYSNSPPGKTFSSGGNVLPFRRPLERARRCRPGVRRAYRQGQRAYRYLFRRHEAAHQHLCRSPSQARVSHHG